MTGDESYHADCFTCRQCGGRIEELVFAKTSQGIYCMTCHNERVARSRRHAEAKQRAKAKKERDRDRDREKRHRGERGGSGTGAGEGESRDRDRERSAGGGGGGDRSATITGSTSIFDGLRVQDAAAAAGGATGGAGRSPRLLGDGQAGGGGHGSGMSSAPSTAGLSPSPSRSGFGGGSVHLGQVQGQGQGQGEGKSPLLQYQQQPPGAGAGPGSGSHPPSSSTTSNGHPSPFPSSGTPQQRERSVPSGSSSVSVAGTSPLVGESSGERRRREVGSLERGRGSPSPTPSARKRTISENATVKGVGSGNVVMLGGVIGADGGNKDSPGIEIDMSYYAEDSQRGSGSTIVGGVENTVIGLGVGPVNGLGVPGGGTSRADKRRSINPGMTLNYQGQSNDGSASGSAPGSAKELRSGGRNSPSPIGDVFASGKLSPLPPSPLRASFTDGEAFKNAQDMVHLETRSASPTPKQGTSPLPGKTLAPGAIGMAKSSTVRGGLGQQAEAEMMGLPSSAPPRSSSLTDGGMKMASAGVASSSSSSAVRPKYNPHHRAFSSERSPTLSSSAQTARDRSASVGGAAVAEPPQIDAPALPSINFSLSDPDFAAWLEEKKMSPEKARKLAEGSRNAAAAVTGSPTPKEGDVARSRMRTTAAERVQPLRQQSNGAGSSSLPSSPVSTGTPGPVHSPPLQRIMFGGQNSPAAGDVVARPTRSDSLTSVTRGKASDTDEPATIRHVRPGLAEHGPQSSTETIPEVGELRVPTVESILPMLQEMVNRPEGLGSGTHQVSTDMLLKVITEIQALTDQVTVLKDKYSGAKRTSMHYMEGMTVAAEEYERAMQAQLEAESEVARLKAEVHGQSARLSLIAEDERRQESMKRQSNDLALNLTGLEKDVSKLKVEREIVLAEVQELAATKADSDLAVVDPAEKGAHLARSLTKRLNAVKQQYTYELEPLTMEKERLTREINELRDTRNIYLEEAAALSAKNDELVDLNTKLVKQTDHMQESLSRTRIPSAYMRPGIKQHMSGSPSMSSIATSATLHDTSEESVRQMRPIKSDSQESVPAARRGFKWMKSSKPPEASALSTSISRPLAIPPDVNKARPSRETSQREHVFHATSILRPCKCEHCGDKMWGLQEVRCATCGIYCHTKCTERLVGACQGSSGNHLREEPMAEAGPSLFGRPLTDQAELDGQQVPVIVTKCIDAVEKQGMEYEGIYRKTGGSSLSKAITNLFERGNYDAFDLNDVDRFNDINSITSVLKSYFRALPNPLLTYELHERFMEASKIREVDAKFEAYSSIVEQLPTEHYATLRVLMLHLSRVKGHKSDNLMNAQNLGVVFGPTLMRSADITREFADMAGKALSIEWMVENADIIFADA